MAKLTKVATDMQKAGPGKLPTPEQADELRSAVEALKVSSPNNPMVKMMEAQLKQLDTIRPKGTAAAAAPPKKALPKAVPLKAAAAPESTSTVSKPAATAAAAPTAASAKPATDAAAGGPQLSPEIEALFAELRRHREEKAEAKRLLDARIKEVEVLQNDLKATQRTESDLRERLRKAETDVSLMRTEVLELKDKTRDLRAMKKAVIDAKSEASEAKKHGAHQNPELERELHETQAALKSERRRTERLLLQSPLAQFGTALADIGKAAENAAQRSLSGLRGDHRALRPHTPETWVPPPKEAFERARDDLWRSWPDVAQQAGCVDAVVHTARHFFRIALPFARFDAVVTHQGGAADPGLEAFIAELVADGRFTSSVDADGVVSVAALPSVLRPDDVGAFGHIRAFVEARKPKARIVPCLTESMIADPARCEFSTRQTTSTKPGGSAANVSESCAVVSLLVDGHAIVEVAAQDTRSAVSNAELAKERVLKVAVPHVNQSISKPSATLLAVDDTNVVDPAAWRACVEPVLASSRISGLDRALVEGLESVVVR